MNKTPILLLAAFALALAACQETADDIGYSESPPPSDDEVELYQEERVPPYEDNRPEPDEPGDPVEMQTPTDQNPVDDLPKTPLPLERRDETLPEDEMPMEESNTTEPGEPD